MYIALGRFSILIQYLFLEKNEYIDPYDVCTHNIYVANTIFFILITMQEFVREILITLD